MDAPPPYVEAARWISRLTTVVVEMVLPALVGSWLDQQFGTSFLTAVGLLLGVPLGFWHLLVITRTASDPDRKRK